jgi:hypothetical protein
LVRREGFRFLSGNGGVALDQRGHDTTGGLNTERKRSDIEKEEVLGLLGSVAGRWAT